MEKRLANYKLYCGLREGVIVHKLLPPFGELQDKKALHIRFEKYLFEGNEWFSYQDEIVNYILNLTEESLKENTKLQFSKYPVRFIGYNYKHLELIERYKFYKSQIEINDWDVGVLSEMDKVIFSRNDNIEILKLLDTNKDIPENLRIDKLLVDYSKITVSSERLKYLYDLSTNEDEDIFDEFFDLLPDSNDKRRFTEAGNQRCKALGYNASDIDEFIDTQATFDKSLIRDKILKEYKIGDIIIFSESKQFLKRLYNELGYGASPKATDLEE